VIKFCPYCSKLHKAIENQNYCSQVGDAITDVSTNAYYFKTNNLYSGEHVSRLSIRTISDGYQYHEVNKKNIVLNKENYLIIREGEEFNSAISTNKEVEGILVAFERDDVLDYFNSYTKSNRQLLDDPFEKERVEVPLESQSVPIRNELKSLMTQLQHGILNNMQYQIYYDELFMQILQNVLRDQDELKVIVKSIDSKKSSTNEEVFRRLRNAKDYIDANLSQNLSIKKISKVATMSPYHFVRSFRKVYRKSPHQYISMQRILFAKFLLRDSDEIIDLVCKKVGFLNSSSFIRLFKSHVGCTPNSYRTSRV